jgi:hypothetical protein
MKNISNRSNKRILLQKHSPEYRSFATGIETVCMFCLTPSFRYSTALHSFIVLNYFGLPLSSAEAIGIGLHESYMKFQNLT